jgi:hypothetical protein
MSARRFRFISRALGVVHIALGVKESHNDC